MSLVQFDDIPLEEQYEPLVALRRYPFVCVPVYHSNGWATSRELFARKQVADKLLHSQETVLQPRGLVWVIYDAWRPRQVQAAIYQHYWRELSRANPAADLTVLRKIVATYVTVPADPARVPPHSTGGSVDLGLWDVTAHRLLDMGAQFDEFIPAVASDYFEQPGRSTAIRDNRRLRAEVLMEEGIVGDFDEYFHKDYGNQKWAFQARLPRAVYAEVLTCHEDPVSLVVKTTYGADEPQEALGLRVSCLGDSLDLSHPVKAHAHNIPNPRELVSAAVAQAIAAGGVFDTTPTLLRNS